MTQGNRDRETGGQKDPERDKDRDRNRDREGDRRTQREGDGEPEGWDFPGGAVVKNPPASAGDTGSSPGPGISHMLQSN